jgi:DNA-binding NarL/FixJ family response regulator
MSAQVDTDHGLDVLDMLTAREREIALQIGGGSSNRAIAQRLGITERTVKAHLGSVFAKLGVHDRLQLALLVTGRMQHSGPTTPVC